MSDNTTAKAIVIAGAMIAFATGAAQFGMAGFFWMLIGVAAGGYLAWREIWGGEINLAENKQENDPVADRFR